MISTKIDPVITKDKSSGRFHRRYREVLTDRDSGVSVDRLLTDERCQADQSGEFSEWPKHTRADRGDGIPVGTDEDLICAYCWPRAADTL